MVPRVIFGRGSFNQVNEVLAPKRLSINAPFIFLIDDVFRNNAWVTSRIQLSYSDRIIFVSAKEEPKTSQVDAIVEDIILTSKERPSGIIGIGGGTLLDLAKAVSIMITNNGEAKDYQGWDLVKNQAIYHVGIPTISGTGAEVSRTTVLTGPEKKLGINSDYTPFDQVILDSELTKDVPTNQWFYTGMDCYIHCIESLTGTYLNTFSESYGNMALDLCKQIFLEDNLSNIEAQEKLMMASWHGGMSIVYSQVGVAHAMSYGLSYLLGTKHGIGNCIVFNQLEEFYPHGVSLFKKMKAKHNITLPQGICSNLSDDEFDTMIGIALSLEPLWENALGTNWRKIMTPEKLKELYQKM
jgi:3-deoxy-alpha-D-manno-octulosonate 8-oxidase